MPLTDVLLRLREAGLDTIPGGGGEILVDRVRQKIGRGKTMSDEWLAVMRAAHQIGMRARNVGRGQQALIVGDDDGLEGGRPIGLFGLSQDRRERQRRSGPGSDAYRLAIAPAGNRTHAREPDGADAFV